MEDVSEFVFFFSFDLVSYLLLVLDMFMRLGVLCFGLIFNCFFVGEGVFFVVLGFNFLIVFKMCFFDFLFFNCFDFVS